MNNFTKFVSSLPDLLSKSGPHTDPWPPLTHNPLCAFSLAGRRQEPRSLVSERAAQSLPHWQENVSYDYKYFIRRFTPSQIRPACLLYLLCSIVFCQLAVLPERRLRLVWGWEEGCVTVVVSYQTAHISLTPLETSSHSFLYQDALTYRLHIQPFISLYPTRACSPLPLFLIFLSKTDPALSSRAWPSAPALLKERRNDLISPPFRLCGLLSLLTHRSLHTEASFPSLCEGKCEALTSQPRHDHRWRSIPAVGMEHAVLPK